MIAVLKHELRGYFHSLTAYVCGAFLLMFIGLGAMLYNIQAAVSNFEFVLNFTSIIFAVIVPILTMKVLAEERKQKTDQLLYSLPLTTAQVILGKFLALLVIYLIPICIIGIYPLIFAKFGAVYLPTSYGSLFAFFLLGAALISLGIFISSLTESQGLAAGVGIAMILFNYYSVQLAEYVSSTTLGTALALIALICLLGLIINHLTRSNKFTAIITVGLCGIVIFTYFADAEVFDGLLPNIMKQLSLFDRLNIFVNGVFDLTAIIYFVTFIAFFLFLSVQSMEKRRYN